MFGEHAEGRVIQALDTGACIRLAQDLIRVPSVTGDERVAQDLVALALEESGLEVDQFEADVSLLKGHPRFPGMEVERTEAVLVAGLLGARGERSLILNGHVDVVPPGDRQAWHASPWSAHIHAGRLYGRGACDMKAGLAIAISAAAALKKSGLPLRGRLVVQSVVGEEDGGIGSFAMAQRGYRADAAFVLEPTRLRIIPAQAGALSFRLRVSGRSAHASVRYEGISAIDKYQVVEARLRQLERSLNQQAHPLFSHYPIAYALSVGRVRAGSWSSTVPDELECEGRVGVPVGMASSEVRRMFAAAVADAAQRDAWQRSWRFRRLEKAVLPGLRQPERHPPCRPLSGFGVAADRLMGLVEYATPVGRVQPLQLCAEAVQRLGPSQDTQAVERQHAGGPFPDGEDLSVAEQPR